MRCFPPLLVPAILLAATLVVAGLVVGEQIEIVMVPCRMGWYDMEHWTPHYTMVPVVLPFNDLARACGVTSPCGDPPIQGHGCP